MIAIRDSLSAITAPWQIATSANVQVVMGGTLTSGIASMDKTLKAFFLGELKGYQSIVEMTRVTGWR
jgi:hypothetical protein